jgi:hypothetical protein
MLLLVGGLGLAGCDLVWNWMNRRDRPPPASTSCSAGRPGDEVCVQVSHAYG